MEATKKKPTLTIPLEISARSSEATKKEPTSSEQEAMYPAFNLETFNPAVSSHQEAAKYVHLSLLRDPGELHSRGLLLRRETRPPKKQAVGEQEYKRSKAHNALGVEQKYNCGYCSRLKTSASLCADGHARIRCACGGQRQDGVPRMHANWKPITGSMIMPIDVQCIEQVEGTAAGQLSITALCSTAPSGA